MLYPDGQIGVSDLFPCLCTDDDIELIDLKKGKHIDQEKGKHIDQEKGKHIDQEKGKHIDQEKGKHIGLPVRE